MWRNAIVNLPKLLGTGADALVAGSSSLVGKLAKMRTAFKINIQAAATLDDFAKRVGRAFNRTNADNWLIGDVRTLRSQYDGAIQLDETKKLLQVTGNSATDVRIEIDALGSARTLSPVETKAGVFNTADEVVEVNGTKHYLDMERVGGKWVCKQVLSEASGCFVAGTPVAIPTGKVRIETLKEGDAVACYDSTAGRVVTQRIRHLITRTVRGLVRVIVGQDTITTTNEHPFMANGRWTEAKHLAKGMRLTLLSGLTALIATVHLYPDSTATVYNFEVPTHHNYYVGSSGVLVHNATKCLGVINKEIEDALGFSFATEKAKESLIVLLREAGFGDNISGLATYKNLLSQFKDDVVFIKELQNIPTTSFKYFLDDCLSNSSLLGQIRTNKWLEAWKIVIKRPTFRKTPSVLQNIDNCLKSEKLMALGIDRNALQDITEALLEDYTKWGNLPKAMDDEIFETLAKFGQILTDHPTTTLTNFSKLLNELRRKATNAQDFAAFTNRKGSYWIIKNMSEDAATFGGKKISFNATQKVNGNSYYVDAEVDGTLVKFCEFKSGPNTINNKEEFLREFVKRDLSNSRVSSLSQIDWRKDVADPTLKSRINGWLNSLEGRAELKKIDAVRANQLLGRTDLLDNTDALKEEIADAFVNHLNVDANFSKIFK